MNVTSAVVLLLSFFTDSDAGDYCRFLSREALSHSESTARNRHDARADDGIAIVTRMPEQASSHPIP